MKPPNKNFVDVVNIEAHANITNTTEDTNAVTITSVSVKDADFFFTFCALGNFI